MSFPVTSRSFLQAAARAGRGAGGRFPLDLPLSFPEHVQAQLESEIIEGRLRPGERVTEEELAERIGVSRTPIREAMHVLETTGLLVRQRGRGTFVAGPLTLDEARTLYDVREAVEGFLAAAAAEHATAAELESLGQLVDEFDAVRQADQGETAAALTRIDSQIHLTIYAAARSELVSVISTYWGRLVREVHARVYQDDHEEFSRQHHQILEALQAHDPDVARRLMTEHLNTGWRRLTVAYAEDAEAT